jgi:hypothetical protein
MPAASREQWPPAAGVTVVACVRLNRQPPFQNVHRHQPVRRMIGQLAARFKGKHDQCDGRAMKDGHGCCRSVVWGQPVMAHRRFW